MAERLKDNRQVAHYWANNVQPTGRGSNFFFEDGVLYSYGRHFIVGMRLPGDVLAITSRSYSMSTAKHINHALHAIPYGRRVLYVPLMDNYLDTAEQVGRNMRNLIERAKKAKLYKVTYAEEALSKLQTFIEFAELRGWGNHTLPPELEAFREEASALATEAPEQAQARLEAERRHQERAKRSEEERVKEERERAAKDIERWRAGEAVYLPRLDGALLRVMPQPTPDDPEKIVIETSWGAEVPATHAWRLWPLIDACHRNARAMNGMSKRVGHYTLTAIATTGDITVGCHKIKYEELALMHDKLTSIGFKETSDAQAD